MFQTLLSLVFGTSMCILLTSLQGAAATRQFPADESLYISRHHGDLNLRPLIGVVSQGGEPAPDGSSYIAASYIKFIEAAGARAVPILHDMSTHEVNLILDIV